MTRCRQGSCAHGVGSGGGVTHGLPKVAVAVVLVELSVKHPVKLPAASRNRMANRREICMLLSFLSSPDRRAVETTLSSACEKERTTSLLSCPCTRQSPPLFFYAIEYMERKNATLCQFLMEIRHSLTEFPYPGRKIQLPMARLM